MMIISADAMDPELVRAHESVHVIQQDFMIRAWSDPVEAWAWSLFTERQVPLDLALVPLLLSPPFLDDFKEAEADALGGS